MGDALAIMCGADDEKGFMQVNSLRTYIASLLIILVKEKLALLKDCPQPGISGIDAFDATFADQISFPPPLNWLGGSELFCFLVRLSLPGVEMDFYPGSDVGVNSSTPGHPRAIGVFAEEPHFERPTGKIGDTEQKVQVGQFVQQRRSRSAWSASRLPCACVRFCAGGGERDSLFGGDVAGQMGVLPCPLELEGGDVGREAGNNAGHLPRSETGARGPNGTSLNTAVMLGEAAGRVGTGADVDTGMADGGAEKVAAVEGGNGFDFHLMEFVCC